MSYIVPAPIIYEQLSTSAGVANSTPDLNCLIIGPCYNVNAFTVGDSVSAANTATYTTTSTTGSITVGLTALTVASASGFSVGDTITIVGAGTSGGNLLAHISAINALVFTIDTPALTTVASGPVIKSTTLGTITAGSNILTVSGPGGFNVGSSIIVDAAADTSGNSLVTTITAINGNQFTLAASAGNSVTNTVVGLLGIITNATQNNNFTIAGQLPGQVIDTTSFLPTIWLNNATVTTVQEGVVGQSGTNVLTVNNPSGGLTTTGTITATQSTLTMTTAAMSTFFQIGDSISIPGAGPAAATLTTFITNINTGTGVITVLNAATTTATTQNITKNNAVNLITATNTLKAQVGDVVKLTYTSNNNVAAQTFTSVIQTITTTGGSGGTITGLTINDNLPTAMSFATTTTSTTTNGATTVNVTSVGSGTAGALLKGDQILVSDGTSFFTTYITNIVSLALTVSPAWSGATIATAATVTKIAPVQMQVIKSYSGVQLPITNPAVGQYNGVTNYSTSTIATNGQVTVNANAGLAYGQIVTGEVHVAYRALRQDLPNILSFTQPSDIVATLGAISDLNPLALALQIALANSGNTPIYGLAVQSQTLAGYQNALALSQSGRYYYLVPLTQDSATLATFQSHVDQMSTPQNALWRVTLNCPALPTTQSIGTYNASSPNNGATISNVASTYFLNASNATFITDGVSVGDTVNITAASAGADVGTWTVASVVSNQQISVTGLTTTATGVSYYITRALTKDQQAAAMASVATVYNDARTWVIQPDTVGVSVNGVVNYLPGYYLAAGLGGMGAGFPVQQGFTNIGVAGISDLQHSNFYFTRTQLNVMAAAGVCLFVQDIQFGLPYCRHELTSNMTTLQQREMLVVKNWDFLAYFFYDKVKGFIGSWNITKDTLNIIRQTLIASAALLKSQKLPKIGPPLIDMTISSLVQDPVNQDQIDCTLLISVVYPANYINIYLVL